VRKIKSNFFISLDGVVEAPDKWHFPYFDDQMGAAVGAAAEGVDAYLMGRVLYEEWAAYWPEHANEPFGDVLNSTKKYVCSNSLTSADWENSEILSGDVASKLADLKAEDGGVISISGSATTVRWLLREGLLDELHLLVHPIVSGRGWRACFRPTSRRHRWSCSARRRSGRASCASSTRRRRTADGGDAVAATVLYMSVSLDGFIAGPTRDRTTGSATAGTACTSAQVRSPAR
jgi:dihydrofolate reductase